MILTFSDFNEAVKFPNIKKTNVDGFVVLIGRDAASNDHLSTVIASDNDLWFHAKGVPGSHVVLVVKENLPDMDLIKKVASLAAENSKMKGNGLVVYCKAKFVTKDPDMRVGQVRVDYKNAEEIAIDL